ncbi:MAG: hypothetical protein ABIP63_04810, partial [Thermoanaerobaculia bacterium]
ECCGSSGGAGMRTACLISMLLIVGCASTRKNVPPPAPADPAATAQESPVSSAVPPAAEVSSAEVPTAPQTVPQAAPSSAAADAQLDARMSQAEPGSIDVVATLRQAGRLASSGTTDQAGELYARVAGAPNASRDAIAAAATGLYRIGDFPGAVRAFARLGAFLRGEEDLRYYDAVALFETGQYEQARIELSCALPYIQITEEVARYRTKIERMGDRPGTP